MMLWAVIYSVYVSINTRENSGEKPINSRLFFNGFGIRPVADFEILNYRIITDFNTSTKATINNETAIGFIPCYAQDLIDFVYLKYKTIYGFPNGYCGQIAEEIQKKIGGELVAGYLAFNTHNREHWWVDYNGIIIDPMSDELKKTDEHTHIEVHRDLSKRYWI